MIVAVVAVRVMQVSAVQVVDMTIMLERQMAAVRAVFVRVFVMGHTNRGTHRPVQGQLGGSETSCQAAGRPRVSVAGYTAARSSNHIGQGPGNDVHAVGPAASSASSSRHASSRAVSAGSSSSMPMTMTQESVPAVVAAGTRSITAYWWTA